VERPSGKYSAGPCLLKSVLYNYIMAFSLHLHRPTQRHGKLHSLHVIHAAAVANFIDRYSSHPFMCFFSVSVKAADL